MKLKNRNLYKKAFRAEFFLGAQKKISDINRVEEFKEDIMLDHRTETFMAVCNVMNYQGGGRAVTYYPAGSYPAYPVFGKGIWLPSFYL